MWFDGTAPFQYDGSELSRNHPSGWATVGDLGRLDEDDYLYLAGRADDVVITGGVNVSPQASEEVLAQHSAVDDVAVVGVPDEELGQRLLALVVAREGTCPSPSLADSLLAECRSRLSKHETPSALEFVDSLPRAENGKLYKRQLGSLDRENDPVRSPLA